MGNQMVVSHGTQQCHAKEDVKYTGPVQHGLQEKGVLHHFHHLQQVQASIVGS